MKVIKSFSLLIASSVMIFFSCTKLDSPYVKTQYQHIKDTTMSWDTITAVRKVLLEDYTGHKCVNCPEAALTAKSLESQYDGRLLVLAVHAGFYSVPGSDEYALDLRTAAGNEWNTEFSFSSYPNGLVNRKVFESSRILSPGKWAGSVSQLIDAPPEAAMMIMNTYDQGTRKVNTTIYNKFIDERPGQYTLTVCLVEDSIIGAQKNNNTNIGPVPDWFDYVFNEVLRGAVNGTYGEDLASDPDPLLTYLARYEVMLGEGMDEKNCWILAFISDKTTREIIQAERKKVIP